MENNVLPVKKIASHWLFLSLSFILFLPIIILPPSLTPSDFSRTILLRLILFFIALFAGYKFFFKKDLGIGLPEWKSVARWPIIAFLAFYAVVIIATIFSQDPFFSFFGSPTRSGGLLTLLSFLAFLAILVLFVQEKTLWEKLIKISFIPGALASLVAVIQYFGLFKNILITWGDGGPPSVIGNSTILAIYMLFLAFAAFAFFLSEPEKKKKLLYGSLALIFIFTIFISGSRATYLGLFISSFFFFFFYPKKFKTFKIAAIIMVIIAILLIALFNVSPNLSGENIFFKKLSSRLSISQISKDLFGTRASVWNITYQAIKEKPMLGWGPENSYIGFEKHYSPTLGPGLQKLWFDMPHNIFLEIWVGSGIFALIFYIAFWVVLFWHLQMFKRKTTNAKDIYLAQSLQAMFLGYLTVLLFNYEGFTTYLISFFFIGFSLFLITGQENTALILPPQKNIWTKNIFLPGAIIFSLLGIYYVFAWNVAPLMLNEKLALMKKSSCKEALDIASNINWENTGMLKSYAILGYANTLQRCSNFLPSESIANAKRALELLSLATKTQPAFSSLWLAQGNFANFLAANEKNAGKQNALLSEAKNSLQIALAKSPGRQEILLELEKTHLIAKDYETMKKTAQDCIDIDKSLGECYWYLGIAQIFNKEIEEGQKNIDQAIAQGISNPAYIQLVAAYLSQNDYLNAIKAYEHISESDNLQATISNHASVAFLYFKTKQYQKALYKAFRVFVLDPSNKETLTFVDSVIKEYSLDEIYKESLREQEKHYTTMTMLSSIYLALTSHYPQNTYYQSQLQKTYYYLNKYQTMGLKTQN